MQISHMCFWDSFIKLTSPAVDCRDSLLAVEQKIPDTLSAGALAIEVSVFSRDR